MRWFPSDRKGRKVSETSIALAVNYLSSSFHYENSEKILLVLLRA